MVEILKEKLRKEFEETVNYDLKSIIYKKKRFNKEEEVKAIIGTLNDLGEKESISVILEEVAIKVTEENEELLEELGIKTKITIK